MVDVAVQTNDNSFNKTIHPYSCQVSKSELCLNSMPPTQTAIEKSTFIEYRPLAAISGETPLIEFFIPSSMDQYLDLDDMFLKVKLRIKEFTSDGKEVDGVNVTPVNNLLHSLFTKIEMTLQDKIVTSSSQHYPYRAYIEKLLGTKSEAKNTYLRCAGWLKDSEFTVPNMDRLNYVKNGCIEVWDRLHVDLCQQSRLMLSGVPLKLALQAHRPEFYLQALVDSKVVITWESVSLYVKHVKLSEYQMLQIESGLVRSPALYPISRNEIRQYIIPSGTSSKTLDNVISGQLPRRIILCMVNNKDENGTITTNPFNFEHHELNYLCCHVNGEQYPSIPYTPNFSESDCMREYLDLYKNLNQFHPSTCTDIRFEEFRKGFTFFVFNLAPDLSDGCDGHLNLIKRGTVRIDMRFKKAPKTVLSVLLFCEYDNVISIDKDRNITLDY